MSLPKLTRRALFCAFGLVAFSPAWAKGAEPLTLTTAIMRALSTNPRLTAADRDIGVAAGRRLQAGALPNPEVSFDIDNAFGSGAYQGLKSAETTLQLSQLFELGGKRDARIAAGMAEHDASIWQRQATKLEVISDTAVAFFSVLAAQRRIAAYDQHIDMLQRLTPLLQRRAEAGASNPGEAARAKLAVDLVKADRERARTASAIARLELGTLMGQSGVTVAAIGSLGATARPPAFQAVRKAVENNPQLMRFTALRAQRDAEFLTARLKPVPDLRAGIAWRHYRETGANAVKVGVSIPIPLWDQNSGNILAAQEARDKVDSEYGVARAALLLTLGRAYANLAGATRELAILRQSALPNSKIAVSAIEDGYSKGRLSLLELLDVHASAAQTAQREIEILLNYHVALATIEGLIGAPVRMTADKTP